MKEAKIISVASHLPENSVQNADLKNEHPEWDMDKLISKIGIETRHIASEDEYASTLAVKAASKLFESEGLNNEFFDYLILVSQSPDYLLPATSSFVHRELGLRSDCGAIDLSQGCSGYVTALGLAKALIESNQYQNVLIITSDTYSKFVDNDDRSVRPIFGDGATATWVSGDDKIKGGSIGHVTQGVDGSGAEQLILRRGGLRGTNEGMGEAAPNETDRPSVSRGLHMDGRAIFNFTIRIAEPTVEEVLNRAQLTKDEIKYFVFHQANAFVLNHMRDKLSLAEEQVPIVMKDFGNTVSGTIPMTLGCLRDVDEFRTGDNLVLFGFGVGLAWAGTTITYS